MNYTIKTTALPVKVERRGRPKTPSITPDFNPTKVELFRGSDLKFSDELFRPIKTNSEIDVILSTEGGLG
jgi:hypothetical protein